MDDGGGRDWFSKSNQIDQFAAPRTRSLRNEKLFEKERKRERKKKSF